MVVTVLLESETASIPCGGDTRVEEMSKERSWMRLHVMYVHLV
jgi:hypothetical protein